MVYNWFHEKNAKFIPAADHYAPEFFKRGASEAAEGCLVSVAAKLVKTATIIPFYIHPRGNKSGRRIWAFFRAISCDLKNCPLTYIRVEINQAGVFGPFFMPFRAISNMPLCVILTLF